MLWQTTDEDLHGVGGVEPPNTIRGEDIDHSRSETAVSQDGHALIHRPFVQRPLLPHDFSIASQIREVQAGKSIFGTYPPGENTRAQYQDWLKAGEPD